MAWVLAVVLGTAAVAAQGAPAAWYPLTAGPDDASGNGQHGAVVGGVSFSSNGALFSPGSAITIPPRTSAVLTVTMSFMLRSDLPESVHNTLLCNRVAGFHYVIVRSAGAPIGFWHQGHYDSALSPQYGTWYNLTAVYNRDSPGSVLMHVNGEYVYNGGGGFDTSVVALGVIGNAASEGPHTNQYARGYIRDVRIYPFGFTDAQINAVFSPSRTLSPTATIGSSATVTNTAIATRSASNTQSITATQTTSASATPVAVWYPLTAGPDDASGNGQHGAVVGGVSFSSNGALFSPGSAITIPPRTSAVLTVTMSFMLRSDLPESVHNTLLCNRVAGFHYVIVRSAGAPIGFWHQGHYDSALSPQYGTWYNLTAVYNRDSPGSVLMHVNGEYVYNGGGGFDTSVVALGVIGNAASEGPHTNQYARGYIRDVRIYPFGFTDAQINAVFSPSSSPSSSPSLTSSSTPTPTLSPTATNACPPSHFQRLDAHGLAGDLLSRTLNVVSDVDCAAACCLWGATCSGYSFASLAPTRVCALFANVTGVVPNILVDSGVTRTLAQQAAGVAGGGAL